MNERLYECECGSECGKVCMSVRVTCESEGGKVYEYESDLGEYVSTRVACKHV